MTTSQLLLRPAPAGGRAALPFTVLGVACILAGGFVAAATAHAPTEHGTWAAAYLVLVAGVAQIGLGLGQGWLARTPPSRAVVVSGAVVWNLGNAAVIAGTVAGLLPVVDIGGALLLGALALQLWITRSAAGGRLLVGYRVLVAVILVSIPIGLVLAGIKH